jgi:hypothetical protein
MAPDPGQLDLFTPDPATAFDSLPPLDQICGQPVAWLPRLRIWGLYCGGKVCVSQTRICKNPNCRRTFDRAVGGARYCSPACRNEWHLRASPQVSTVCPRDGNLHTNRNQWQLCGDCFRVISGVFHRLAAHHVPAAMVLALIDDPTCHVSGCGVNLLIPVAGLATKGNARVPLHVDHDHACCPGGPSCGHCIRGLICHWCNHMLGHAREDPARLQGGAMYLERYRARR